MWRCCWKSGERLKEVEEGVETRDKTRGRDSFSQPVSRIRVPEEEEIQRDQSSDLHSDNTHTLTHLLPLNQAVD